MPQFLLYTTCSLFVIYALGMLFSVVSFPMAALVVLALVVWLSLTQAGGAYVLKRLLLMIPTLVGITVIVFCIARLAPGDPVMASFQSGGVGPGQTMSGGGDDDATKQSGIERRRKELGLDKPLYEQYALWIWNMGQGNFGRSTKYEAPVAPLMWEAMGVTIKLNLISLLIVYVISIPLGVHAAIRRGKPEEKAIGISLFGMFSAPSFWVATLLLFYFCNPANLNWFDPVGLHSQGYQDLPLNGQLRDWAWHAVLPVICMTYSGLAMLSRFARTGMLEVIRKDYIRTARAKGLPERQVILKHALRNSLIPIVTLMAALLPGMIGGSVIIEYIFTIKGMGKLGFDAILSRDYDMIMAITTLSAVLVMFGMLLSDLLYTVVDPRISLEG